MAKKFFLVFVSLLFLFGCAETRMFLNDGMPVPENQETLNHSGSNISATFQFVQQVEVSEDSVYPRYLDFGSANNLRGKTQGIELQVFVLNPETKYYSLRKLIFKANEGGSFIPVFDKIIYSGDESIKVFQVKGMMEPGLFVMRCIFYDKSGNRMFAIRDASYRLGSVMNTKKEVK